MQINNFLAGALMALFSVVLLACGGQEARLYQDNFGVEIDTQLKYENDLFYPIRGDEPFTGQVEWRYAGGNLAAIINYEEGHLVSRKGYYRDGKIMNELQMRNDTLVTSITWYPSGQMKTKYDNGLVKEWYYNGQIRAIWNTDSAGVLEGKATAWYPDGTLLGIENYKNGELDGERTLYDSTGTVSASGFYSEGEELKSN